MWWGILCWAADHPRFDVVVVCGVLLVSEIIDNEVAEGMDLVGEAG
jgi:hypothetical protein